MNNPLINPKPLPKKLEEDLNNVGRIYKNSSQGKISTSQEAEAIAAPSSRRPSALSQMFDDSAEKAMYDEFIGSHLQPKGRLPAGSGFEATRLSSKTHKTSVSTSSDFTSTLLQRLTAVEGREKENRQQLATQIARNEELEETVKMLRAETLDSSATMDELKQAKRENDALKRHIQEMEKFLADYGLVWVGNNSDDQQRGRERKGTDDEEGMEHLVTFAEFARHIKELNEIIYSEPTQIVKTERSARLAHASEVLPHVRIAFHRNGLMIKRGPFRACHSDSYLSFVRDVVDGYFPSEFRKEYPDGVIFDLVDKHEVDYVEGAPDTVESLSSQQFLNRLPKTVVRNGEIVQVRGDIEKRLKLHNDVTSQSVDHALPKPSSLYDSHDDTKLARPKTAAEKIKESFAHSEPDPLRANYGKVVELHTPASDAPPSGDDEENPLGAATKVHIKWLDRTTLLAAMHELNTIKELRQVICKHFHLKHMDNVELRTTYPAKLLLDGMTLMEAGLVPNGTVHARKL